MSEYVPIDDEAVTAAMKVIVGRILSVHPNARQRALDAFLDILRQTVQLATALDDVSDPRPH